MIERLVKDCNDCPFMTFGGWEGEDKLCSVKTGTNEERTIQKCDFGKVEKTPNWCPLNFDKILVIKDALEKQRS